MNRHVTYIGAYLRIRPLSMRLICKYHSDRTAEPGTFFCPRCGRKLQPGCDDLSAYDPAGELYLIEVDASTHYAIGNKQTRHPVAVARLDETDDVEIALFGAEDVAACLDNFRAEFGDVIARLRTVADVSEFFGAVSYYR